MKKIAYISLVIYSLIIEACVKNTTIVTTPGGSDLIGYNVIKTKSESTFPTDWNFVSAAYKTNSGQNWDQDRSSASVFFGKETVSYDTNYNFWKTENDYYWPTDGSRLTFFSYAPASIPNASISVDGVKINGWNVETHPLQVILVADIAKDRYRNETYAGYNGVPTAFRHKLAKLNFKVGIAEEAEENTMAFLKKITICDVFMQGDYERGGYANNTWGNLSEIRDASTPMVVYVNNSGLELSKDATTLVRENLLVIPQSLIKRSSAEHPYMELEYDLYQGGSAVAEATKATIHFDDVLRQGSWEIGKSITYTIRIGVGQFPIEFDGSVEDWKARTDGILDISTN